MRVLFMTGGAAMSTAMHAFYPFFRHALTTSQAGLLVSTISIAMCEIQAYVRAGKFVPDCSGPIPGCFGKRARAETYQLIHGSR